MSRNLGLAFSGDTAFVIMVENDGYTIEEYKCTDFGIKNFDGCFAFTIEKELYICVRKQLHHFDKDEYKWKEMIDVMESIRCGPACVSLEQGTIITGGEVSEGDGAPKLSNTCTLIKHEDTNIVMSNIGKLPASLKNHTLTKVSDNAFILCGGIDVNGYETRDVYLGSLKA